jgi:transcriptional regulator with XRE-family HTH domain
MYPQARRASAERAQELRKEAGRWLRELRMKRGLSQRGLAQKVRVEYYAFVAQLEAGRGRIPPDRYLLWAAALGVEPRKFVGTLMSLYDPVTYNIAFGPGESPSNLREDAGRQRPTGLG